MRHFFAKNLTAVKIHIALASFWVLIAIPGVTLWKDSILFVIAVSIYANFVGHISSYQAAASAGVDDATHEKLNAIADALADFLAECGHPDHATELRRTVGLELEE
jgi:hypothetical protein